MSGLLSKSTGVSATVRAFDVLVETEAAGDEAEVVERPISESNEIRLASLAAGSKNIAATATRPQTRLLTRRVMFLATVHYFKRRLPNV